MKESRWASIRKKDMRSYLEGTGTWIILDEWKEGQDILDHSIAVQEVEGKELEEDEMKVERDPGERKEAQFIHSFIMGMTSMEVGKEEKERKQIARKMEDLVGAALTEMTEAYGSLRLPPVPTEDAEEDLKEMEA